MNGSKGMWAVTIQQQQGFFTHHTQKGTKERRKKTTRLYGKKGSH